MLFLVCKSVCSIDLVQGHCVVVLMAVLEQMTPRHYQQLRLSLMDTSNTESVDLGVRAGLLCVC